jgi:hypothetical protein
MGWDRIASSSFLDFAGQGPLAMMYQPMPCLVRQGDHALRWGNRMGARSSGTASPLSRWVLDIN